jgi:4-amino-4-deoxy-L-arabinose transferase-like glycosyltransferase
MMKRPKIWLLSLLLLIQTIILFWVAWSTAPGWDEWAHLPSGLYTLQYGDYRPYSVNPPLTRLWSAIPVWLAGGGIAYEPLPKIPGFRPEWVLAGLYSYQKGEDVFFWMSLARTATIPIALWGTLLIFKVGRRLFCERTAWIAAIFWVFSPTVVTFGASITPDVTAAVFGFWAAWCNYVWLRLGKRRYAVWLGVALATAMLSKASWLILPPVLIGLGLLEAWRWGHGWWSRKRVFQIVLAITVCYLSVHACFEFQGMLVPLGNFEFVSESFRGLKDANALEPGGIGNRFQGSWLQYIPAPLPADYLLGVDLQKLDFEGKFTSYFWGQNRDVGWWYYYAVGIWLKEPLALWILVVAGVSLRLRCACQRTGKPHVRCRLRTWARFHLLAPGTMLLLFVSIQTGFNHHLRYVLPFLPCLYILCAASINVGSGLRPMRFGAAFIAIFMTWYVVSSVSILPRSYAYFSEGIGGSKQGWKYLGNSNVDWGQDLLTIKRWVTENPDKRPVYLVYQPEFLDYARAGIDARNGLKAVNTLHEGPNELGWWVVCTGPMLSRPYDWFRNQKPYEELSVTTNVYDFTAETSARENIDR